MSEKMNKAREALRLKRFTRNSQPSPTEEKKEEPERSIVTNQKETIPLDITESIEKEKPIEPEVAPAQKEEEPMQEIFEIPNREEENREEVIPQPQKKIVFQDLFILPPKNNEEMEIITEKPVPRTIPRFPISQYAKMKQPTSYHSSSNPNSSMRNQNYPPSGQRSQFQYQQQQRRNYSEEEEDDEEEDESEQEEPPYKRQRPNPTFSPSQPQPIPTSSPPSQGIIQRLGGMYNSIPAPVRSVASSYGPNVLVAIGSGTFLFVRALLQKWSLQSAAHRVSTNNMRVDPNSNQITQPMNTTMSVHIPSPPIPSGDFSNF